ncbi:MAG: HTTM domain-containing protein [Halobacteriales archaeon]|nr:HTTM domain-containing protein [Halobacteriales archaeon]
MVEKDMGVSKRAKRLAGRAQDGIARRLAVDRRALAVFRVGLGVVILVDILTRSFDFVAFYTDEGVLPSSYLASDPLSSLSVHFLLGGVRFQAFLFALTALFALLLVVGYRTRFATLASFVLVTSLQEYNPYVLNAGDSMLRWYLFFGVFLPLGARWSLDSLNHGMPDTNRFENIAGGSALLYAVMIYTVNGLSKLGSDAWTNGEAVADVLSTDKYTVLLGNHMGGGEFTELLVFFNWAWLVLLTASVLLVLLTWWLRFLFAGAFIVAHTGMFLTMQLGIFPLIAVTVLTLFLPPVFWDRVEYMTRRFGVSEERARRLSSLLWAESEPLTPKRIRGVVSDTAPVFVGIVLLTSVMWQVDYAGYGDVPEEIEDVADPVRESWNAFRAQPAEFRRLVRRSGNPRIRRQGRPSPSYGRGTRQTARRRRLLPQHAVAQVPDALDLRGRQGACRTSCCLPLREGREALRQQTDKRHGLRCLATRPCRGTRKDVRGRTREP